MAGGMFIASVIATPVNFSWVAQQIRHDLAGERGRHAGVERPHVEVAGHDQLGAGRDPGLERRPVLGVQAARLCLTTGRSSWLSALVCPCPGKCLRPAATPRPVALDRRRDPGRVAAGSDPNDGTRSRRCPGPSGRPPARSRH